MLRFRGMGVCTLVLAVVPAVRAQTWNNFTGPSFDWNTAANWTPATVPNSATANVIFPDVPTGQNGQIGFVNISASVSAQSLSFTNTMGSYQIVSNTGSTLSNVQTITIAPGVTGIQVIDLTSVAIGSLLFPNGTNLTITNNIPNQSALAGGLDIGPGTVIGTPGSGGVIFTGPGAMQFGGSFASAGTPNNEVDGGLAKIGPGYLDYSGTGATLSGGITLSGGTLVLDYIQYTTTKLNGGGLYLYGGVLSFSPNGSSPFTQTIPAGTFVNAGQTDVRCPYQGTVTLAAGAITHSVGGTVDFAPANSGGTVFSITTTTGNTNGLLGTGPAFATVNGGATWATVSGGAIVGLATYGTNTYTSGTNTDVTASSSLTGITTNSLRFNTGNLTLTSSVTNTLQSGGILVTPNATGGTITGGTLTASSSGELFVHQYGTGTFTINSTLVSTIGLTKDGPGILQLGGTNTGLTGPINVNRGGLTVTNAAAINSASQINFNDDRYNPTSINGLQQFTVDLGNFVNATITPPIRLSAFAYNDYGTYFSTGNTFISTVTLGGVISSGAGLTTPIRFTNNTLNNGSQFNLTNVNTFTGNVSLFQGSLGINSDASLGHAANTLFLDVAAPGSGGLVFLNSGITVAHAVTVDFISRIVSNGTDSNTISGPITATSGNGATLVKDGTGTLTITNANNNLAAGGVQVTAGTLSLGSTGTLGAGTNVTVNAGATFSPGTATNSGIFTNNAIGTVTLQGGTFAVSSGSSSYLVNQIATSSAGGTINYTGAASAELGLTNAGAAITIGGNSTWVSPANSATIVNFTAGAIPITIPAGVTLNNGIALTGAGFQIIGGGTLFQNSDATNVLNMTAAVTVSQGEFRVTDASSNDGVGNLGTGTFTLDGGTFSYGGASAVTQKTINITSNGGTVQIESAATLLNDLGTIVGPGGLTKIGPGTLAFGSGTANSFSSLAITAGTIDVLADNSLGTGPVTIAAAGTLLYGATASTARTFNLNYGTLQASGGTMVTLNGAAVNGGFIHGPGTFTVTGGTALSGVTASANTVINQTGAGSFVNFSNSGSLTVAAGAANPSSFASFINQGSGSITIGAGSAVNAADFQTYGTLTLTPNTTATPTILTNTGTTPLSFNGGSQTFLGTPATADPTGQNILDYIDLHGNNAIVAGGLFVNNGGVFDTVGAGTGTVIAEFGALVKGAGFFQNTVKTQNGGKFQTGNSPGSATFGNFVFGPGGVNNYVFAIDDATGMAGPSPNASGLVSGWGLIKAVQVSLGTGATSGNFTWTAAPANPLMVAIDTLVNPTMVGTDVAGPMADFDPNQPYSWTAARWTGAYSGPTDVATLDADTSFDTSGVVNPIAGTFGWSLDSADQTLSLVYTPSSVPEPGTLALAGLAAAGLAWRRHGTNSAKKILLRFPAELC